MEKNNEIFFLLLQYQGVGKYSLKNCFIIPNQWIQKNSVTLSVLMLEQRYLHHHRIEFSVVRTIPGILKKWITFNIQWKKTKFFCTSFKKHLMRMSLLKNNIEQNYFLFRTWWIISEPENWYYNLVKRQILPIKPF